jgi:hypothetical protein
MAKVDCKDCEGTGLALPLMEDVCQVCGGSGQVQAKKREEKQPFPDTAPGKLAQALCDLEYATDWEIQFINNFTERVLKDWRLTDKQMDTAINIVSKYDQHKAIILQLEQEESGDG